MVTATVTIPKRISGGEELVVVKRADFEVFQKWQNEINNALSKVRRGREEYKNKKTIMVASPKRFR